MKYTITCRVYVGCIRMFECVRMRARVQVLSVYLRVCACMRAYFRMCVTTRSKWQALECQASIIYFQNHLISLKFVALYERH